MKIRIVAILICLLIVSGCSQPNAPQSPSTGNVIPVTVPNSNIPPEEAESIYSKIGKMPTFDNNSINSFESYKNFADSVNNLIDILEEKTDVKIPKPEATLEGYNKVSNVINEYAPLVENYNDVIYSARAVKENDTKSQENFYKNASIFGVEFAIVYVAAFATPAYNGVGIIYRASGFQTLAFKCGSCVSVVLSESHWFVRTVLVEGSSQAIKNILDQIQELNSK